MSDQDKMKRKSCTLALVQMKVQGGNRESNLSRAEDKITEAVRKGADIILLPEAMDLGWTHPSALTDATPIPEGVTSQFISLQAIKHKVYICSGLIERDEDHIYNSAILVNPDGQVVLKHRKINELDIGLI